MYTFDNIIIKKLPLGQMQTNCFIIENKENALLTIIDPGSECERIIAELGDKKIDKIILTHGHFDHIMAVNDLVEKYNAELYLHELEVEMIENAEKNGALYYTNTNYTISKKPNTFQDGDCIESSGLSFEVLHTPGHTKGSSCFKLLTSTDNLLFTGDTVFKGGYGRTDLYGGDFSTMVKTMRRLLKLPTTHLCFCGHGEETTIGKK